MPIRELVATAVFCALFGLLLLFMLWPDRRQGLKVLNRWGVRTPTDAEVTDAVRYLRRRRLCYPWLFIGIALLGGSLHHARGLSLWVILGTLLFGGLLAELLGFRPERGTLPATGHRGLVELVPGWALACYPLLGAAVVVIAGIGVAGHDLPVWAGFASSPYRDRPALALLVALGSMVAVGVLVLLAARRPSSASPQADLVLRVRSARVAIGVGLAALGSLVRTENGFVSLAVFVACVAAWLALTAQQRPVPVRVLGSNA